MKRGITGVYHHVSPQHLKRYLAEYDFRYAERATKAVQGVVGKRMTYQQTNGGPDEVSV
jgi:ISXO2-like transposase domain